MVWYFSTLAFHIQIASPQSLNLLPEPFEILQVSRMYFWQKVIYDGSFWPRIRNVSYILHTILFLWLLPLLLLLILPFLGPVLNQNLLLRGLCPQLRLYHLPSLQVSCNDMKLYQWFGLLHPANFTSVVWCRNKNREYSPFPVQTTF